MMHSTFTKFDPRAFLESEMRRAGPAKPANPAKASGGEADPTTLVVLATLAGSRTETEHYEPASHTWTDEHEERAAIVEHDGGAPRAWAEGFARLDPAKPPADVSPKRWLRFVDDCGRFLDAGWAARAAELGWGPLDLFGCDRERPFARMGLLWLVNGGTVVELHRDRAVIATLGDARQAYRRRPLEVGRIVLAWELDRG